MDGSPCFGLRRPLVPDAQDLGVRVVQHQADDGSDFGGAEVRMLAPGTADPVTRRSDESLVMKVAYGKTSALLEGDAEKRSEQQIAEEQPEADLLKVAHPGSATSSIPLLLDRVHPRFAVISVGSRNTYGHPRREVLARLGDAHVVTYRTDLDGAVTFYLDGSTVSPSLPLVEVH
jgi:competence protein ComEC